MLRFHYNAVHVALQGISAAISIEAAAAAGLINFFAPIHQLPSNIVTDICLLSLQSSGQPIFEAGVYYRQLETLSQVCSTWRDWIQREPRLWAYVNTMDKWPIVKRALRRSAAMPLTVIAAEDLSQTRSHALGCGRMDVAMNSCSISIDGSTLRCASAMDRRYKTCSS